VRWNDTEIQLKWVRPELPEIPLYVAGYGPKVLSIAGRVADGVVIQLADPDIVEWTMGLARRAAEEAGRDPAALEPIVCAPCVVSDDLASARDQVRWFPAMVSNHVVDLLSKYPKEELPAPLVRYVEKREFYDYSEHSRLGASHGAFVDDETCDRFCILGTAEEHVEKLRRLEEIGVRHWNIYLMTEGQEETLGVYGNEIIPEFDRVPA
jgi:alkanesulfonate monooxygenase SsuD/methylene tetrahydromethanopterin reductase-like flavin-dependent oxidoreductase (luciferase family)